MPPFLSTPFVSPMKRVGSTTSSRPFPSSVGTISKPVLALVTDGLPTDDFQAGLDHLLSRPWGRQALRIVVAIGEDSASNEAQEIFRAFMANDALRPFHANNPEALAEQIRWVSTAVLQSVSSPAGPTPDPISGKTAAGWTASLPLMTVRNPATPDEADIW
jgi:uncharacterized protein YegL